MVNLGVLATVLGLIFLAELPDKTAVAGLVLGSRYPARWLLTGMFTAFAVHVVIAVAAGSLLSLLPRRPVEAVTAALFLLGAVLVWREGSSDTDDDPAAAHADDAADAAEAGLTVSAAPAGAGFGRVALLGFVVIFAAEWGDLTQILTADLAAKYHDPVSVGIGAVLGLWAVGALAVLGGRSLLAVLPIRWVTRLAALAMVTLAGFGFAAAVG